jgi:hypothetical protein
VSGVRGWLLVYTISLAYLLLHGAGLTIASLVIYAHPALAGLRSFVPLRFLVLYVATNVLLILYTITLFVLMARKRRAAIVHNVIFNVLGVVFLLAWHVLGEKSNVGTVVDTLPYLIGLAYVLRSRRVRNTFRLQKTAAIARTPA